MTPEPEISTERRERYAKSFQRSQDENKLPPEFAKRLLERAFPLFKFPTDRDVFLMGDWLYDELRAIGVPKDKATDCCFAYGQRLAHSFDPWGTTLQTLERAKRGEFDKPGPQLAATVYFSFLATYRRVYKQRN